jgi:hypothetical protein
MADTYTKLDSISVGSGGAASLTFSNIAQTYTDLLIKISSRDALGSTNVYDILTVTINGTTNGTMSKTFYGTGSGTANSDQTPQNAGWLGYNQANGGTANIFDNQEFYFGNYGSCSEYKTCYFLQATENSAGAIQTYGFACAANPDPITSISFTSANAVNFLQNTTVTLYGVFNADVSTPASTPTIGTASSRNTAASVSFTEVSNAASYLVTSNPGGITGTGTASPVIVKGLTNGTAYTFTVQAVNPFGVSGASAASNSATPTIGNWVQTITQSTPTYYNGEVVLDSSGNAYYVGSINSRAFIYSVDKNGVYRWGRYYSMANTGFPTSLFEGIKLGSDGFLYVAGYSRSTAGSDGLGLVAKFSTSGVLQWSKTVDDATYGYDALFGLDLDSSNNVYVTGQLHDPSFGLNITKFNSSGVHQSSIYSTSSLGNCTFWKLHIDSSGNIYGFGRGTQSGYWTGIVAKFNSSLSLQFLNEYYYSGASGTSLSFYDGVVLGSNLYVVGANYTYDSGALLSFTTSGSLNYSRGLTGAGSGALNNIQTDGTNLYMSGFQSFGSSYNQGLWMKTDTTPNISLQRRIIKATQSLEPRGGFYSSTDGVYALSGINYTGASNYQNFSANFAADGSGSGQTTSMEGVTYTYNTPSAAFSSISPISTGRSTSFSSWTPRFDVTTFVETVVYYNPTTGYLA